MRVLKRASSFVLFATVLSALPLDADNRPNFLFFITDDISPDDLGCYGNDAVKTSNLDRLAREGLVFENAYLTISSCSPSRCSIITGRYPHNTGAPELHTTLPVEQFVFPAALRAAGYYTALSGKGHMGNVRRGFDLISKGKGPGKEGDWIDILRSRPRDKPFFFWFASTDAHRQWQLDENGSKYDPSEVIVPPFLLDGPKTRQDLAGYYHEVSRTDHFAGELVAELKRQGVDERTYFIYCSDNGRPFPRCKTRLYDSGIKTPLIIRRPGKILPGRTASLVSVIDFAPTFLELAGVRVPASLQGVSLAPILLDATATVRDYAFAEHNWHVYQAHERMVRHGPWLYIRNAFPERQNLCVESDPTFPAGSELWAMSERGELKPEQGDIFLKPRPAEELYDVEADPHQLRNLADEPSRFRALMQLRDALDLWAIETGDTVPAAPTPDRQGPRGRRNPEFARGEFPGAARGAEKVDHPGPVRGEYDVVVYGGTSAGVAAAVQASRMGKSVIIVGPDRHLGGLSSGGLGWTDTGNKKVIGGVSREFYHRVWKHYQTDSSWKWQKRSEYGNRGQGTSAIDGERRTMWIFEPHVAEKVFDDLVREHGIPVDRDRWLDRGGGVRKVGGRIVSISMLSGETYRGRVFIDATYEGDLLAAAGVRYRVGRESNAEYGESWNGVQKGARHHRHYFAKPVDPWIVPGDPASGLLPRISAEPPGEDGIGDHRVQAYCFRMCLTDRDENRIPFAKPVDYDPKQYEVLARVFASGWREVFHKFDPIPNRKTDTNNHGPFSTDNIGRNYAYPDGTYEVRRRIIAEHESYQKGLMYFLANDPRVPEEFRTKMSRWGLSRDEFTDNGHWPHQIYVREARRMVGAYVMNELDCLGTRATPAPIGMGSYSIDSHNVQRYVTADGHVQNEGDIGVRPKQPYQVSYGSIVPKEAECVNLLVPVCLSATHSAFGSIRMEPVFMILGQSAATAACHALELGVPVQKVPYAGLRRRLLADGQVLEN